MDMSQVWVLWYPFALAWGFFFSSKGHCTLYSLYRLDWARQSQGAKSWDSIVVEIPVVNNAQLSKGPQHTLSDISTCQVFIRRALIPCDVIIVFTMIFAQQGTSMHYEYQVRMRMNCEWLHSVRYPLSPWSSEQIGLSPWFCVRPHRE